MQRLIYFFLILSLAGYAQVEISAIYKDSMLLEAKKLFGVDTFGTLYYSSKNNSFHKRAQDTTITYANFQLGDITTANTFNPLKINLFYQDFNTVIILDNRLAEVFKVDFNTTLPYINVSYVSTGFDNTLWLFNQDLQQLELYDYKTRKTRIKTVPVQSEVLDLKSDYNNCYLLTEKFLYVYSYFGSLIAKYSNEGYESLGFSKAHLILRNGKQLFILQKNDNEIKAISHPNLLIKQFLTTNESLYIYEDKILRHYQLKID